MEHELTPRQELAELEELEELEAKASSFAQAEVARFGKRTVLNAALPITRYLPLGAQNALGSVALGGVQGATLGFGDEIAAGLSALSPNVTYKDAVKDFRTMNNQARSDNPYLYTGGEVLGGFTTGGVGATRVAAAKGVKQIATRSAQLGGASGGIYGAGTAEGGVVKRAKGAAIGTAIGAVAGGALGPLAHSVGGVVTRFKSSPKAERLAKADRIILREVMRQNNVSRDEAVNLITSVDTNDAALMFQTLGLQEFAEGANTLGGNARKVFEGAIETQKRDQKVRILRSVRNVIGVDDFTSLNNEVAQSLSIKGKHLYQSAFQQPFKVTPKLTQLMQRPAAKDAAEIANRVVANKGMKLKGTELEYFHLVKEGLDSKISSSLLNPNKADGEAILSLQRELLGELDSIVPQYAGARKLWAGEGANETALQFGRSAFKMDVEKFAAQTSRYSQGERQYALAGVLRAVDHKLKQTPLSSTVSTGLEDSLRGVLKAVLPEDQASKIAQLLKGEANLTQTGRRVLATADTPTGPNHEAAERVAKASRGIVRKTVRLAANEGFVLDPAASARKYVSVLAKEATRQDPVIIEALAFRLAGTPEEVAEAFARLSPAAKDTVQQLFNKAGGPGAFIAGAEANIFLKSQ